MCKMGLGGRARSEMLPVQFYFSSLKFLESTALSGARVHGCTREVVLSMDANTTGPVTSQKPKRAFLEL